MMRNLGFAAILALVACATAGPQQELAKARLLANEFLEVCLKHPRDDESVMAVAAARGIPVEGKDVPHGSEPKKSVILNSVESPWGPDWSCLLQQEDTDVTVSDVTLTLALDRWADGEPIVWEPPKPHPEHMPALHFARRQVGNEFLTIRTNRLDHKKPKSGALVFYFHVSKEEFAAG